jgi:hypothetical protein
MPLSTFNGVRKVLFLHLLTFTALLMAMPKLASLHPVSQELAHLADEKWRSYRFFALIRKMANNCLIPSFSRTKKPTEKIGWASPDPQIYGIVQVAMLAATIPTSTPHCTPFPTVPSPISSRR